MVKTGSLAPVQPETVRRYCNILSVSLSQSPLMPESASSPVISVISLFVLSGELIPHPVQDRARAKISPHHFFLSAPVMLFDPGGEAVGNIKIRFTEIIFVESNNYPLMIYKLLDTI